MKQFNLRKRVADLSQAPLIVVPITLDCPALVEIAGFAGAEAVLIDTEHGMMGPETVRSMLAHAESAGTAAVYRPRCFDAAAHWTAKGMRFFEADTPDYLLRETYAAGLSALRAVFEKSIGGKR